MNIDRALKEFYAEAGAMRRCATLTADGYAEHVDVTPRRRLFYFHE